MNRAIAAALAFLFFVIPLFPSFITLTAVSIPGVSLLTRATTIGLLALCIALASFFLGAILIRRPFVWPPTVLALTIWTGTALLAGLLGFNPTGGLLFIGIAALGIVWHSAILRFYRLPGVARAIYYAFLLSGTLASAIAIGMVLLRVPADQYTIGHGRAIGTFILPGELAGYLIIFLPIAYAIARIARERLLRTIAWTALCTGTFAFVLTFSRAGWMGLAAAIAFYAFMRGNVQRRYAPLFPLAGLAAVLIVFNAHHNPSENYTRLSIWQAGIEMVRRFPLTGVGPFDFARIYAAIRLPDGDAQAFHAHSFLLTIFAETGLVGLIAVLYAWWRFALELAGRLRRAPSVGTALALAIAAGLVGTWVQGLIDTVSVVIFGLWMPVMALALAAASDGLGENP